MPLNTEQMDALASLEGAVRLLADDRHFPEGIKAMARLVSFYIDRYNDALDVFEAGAAASMEKAEDDYLPLVRRHTAKLAESLNEYIDASGPFVRNVKIASRHLDRIENAVAGIWPRMWET